MASVPATTDGSNEIDNVPQESAAPRRAPNNDLLAGFGRLDLLRQLGLMVGLMASVAIGFAVVLWSQGGNYQPIYGNMAGYDSVTIMETLTTEAINYRVDPNTGVILVPEDDLANIRLRLSAAGISRYAGTGYELLDQEQALGTSQFMEANRVKRSQEGELQRTISNFRNVQSARVHIAIPERSVFVRSSQKPTASVFLVTSSSAGISKIQIAAIANLVASSVPELIAEDVTIVDQRGNLLTQKEGNSMLEVADRQFEYVRKYERTLVDRVGGILRPLVGLDGFQAEINADIDFTQIEQADESYDPANRAIRFEQTLTEQRAGAGGYGGVPGSLSNQPPADATIADGPTALNYSNQAVDGNSRQEATRNYELDRRVSYTNHDPVTVRRLSVAVLIDNRQSLDGGESLAWTEAELAQITTLVQDAVGFSVDRGDSVSVINNSFLRVLAIPIAATPIWQQAWLQTLIKQVLAGLFVLLIVLGVLRPVLRSLAKVDNQSRQLALAATQTNYSDFDMGDPATVEGGARLAGRGASILPTAEGTSYDRQLNTVKALATEDPARVAQVVKQWVGDHGE